ncbi:MAG: efflux RND transporter periplasmic adaptor subunit [Alphaproteobacteria bacterium]
MNMDLKRLRSWAWPAGISLLVAAGLAFSFWPRAVEVDVAEAIRAPMMTAISDDGITRVREVYVLSAPIAGKLLRVESHAGDFIEARKTVVATIEPSDPAFLDARAQRQLAFTVSAARAARDLAQANVQGRDAERKLAARELERARELFGKGVVAKARVDAAEASLSALDAALATASAAQRQREIEIQTSEAALIEPGTAAAGDRAGCCIQLRAPVDGQLLRVLQENESIVMPGQPIAEVGDPANLEIVVDLVSSEAVQVADGDEVIISQWGGQGDLQGRVRRVEPFGQQKVSALGIEERRVNVVIDIVSPRNEWARLGHGFQVEASIVRWRGENVLQVPVGALFRQGKDWAVYRVDGNRARLTTVVTGHLNDAVAEITQGLEPGARVILHPGESVSDGGKVTAR